MKGLLVLKVSLHTAEHNEHIESKTLICCQNRPFATVWSNWCIIIDGNGCRWYHVVVVWSLQAPRPVKSSSPSKFLTSNGFDRTVCGFHGYKVKICHNFELTLRVLNAIKLENLYVSLFISRSLRYLHHRTYVTHVTHILTELSLRMEHFIS